MELIQSDNVKLDMCIDQQFQKTTMRDLTFDEKVDIVKLHNAYRRGLGAANAFQMTWSNELAENARFFAKQCQYKNSVKGTALPLSENLIIFNFLALAKKIIDFNYGESLAAVEHNTELVDWDHVVYDWYASERFYDPVKKSCSGDCRPYKNIAFWESTEVGCGIAECDDLFDGERTFEKGRMIICQYRTQERKREAPFFEGPSCSYCGANSVGCENGLCVPKILDQVCDFITTTKAPAIITSPAPATTPTSLPFLEPAVSKAPEIQKLMPKKRLPFVGTQRNGFIDSQSASSLDSKWFIRVPAAKGYEITVMELELDSECSDSLIFWDDDTNAELYAMRSCDPKVLRMMMKKEPIVLKANKIRLEFNQNSHLSVRGSGFRLFYDAIIDENSPLLATSAPDLCDLLQPCGVGGICKNIDGDFACACKDGFESFNDGHGCRDVDECKIAEADDDTNKFYSIFYAYPDFYDFALNGMIFNATDDDLRQIIAGSGSNLKSSANSNELVSVGDKLNSCRVFCSGAENETSCLFNCISKDYDVTALNDQMIMQLPNCIAHCRYCNDSRNQERLNIY